MLVIIHACAVFSVRVYAIRAHVHVEEEMFQVGSRASFLFLFYYFIF
jgi:hypothetical protein